MDADPGPPAYGRYAVSSSGRPAAVVQGEAGPGPASAQFPEGHGRPARAVPGFEPRTHRRATGTLPPQAQTGAAALGTFGGHGGLAGTGVPECGGALPGARLGAPT